MCFIKDDYAMVHSVTEKDVSCYKVMELTASGTLRSLMYKRDKHYYLGDIMYPDVSIDANKLDEFTELGAGVIHSNQYDGKNIKMIKEELLRKRFCFPRVIVKCVIPKGTPYWDNVYEFASTRLKLKEIIPIV